VHEAVVNYPWLVTPQEDPGDSEGLAEVEDQQPATGGNTQRERLRELAAQAGASTTGKGQSVEEDAVAKKAGGAVDLRSDEPTGEDPAQKATKEQPWADDAPERQPPQGKEQDATDSAVASASAPNYLERFKTWAYSHKWVVAALLLVAVLTAIAMLLNEVFGVWAFLRQ
ncbi:unnamed protein product, partial [marine sediment metagenome]